MDERPLVPRSESPAPTTVLRDRVIGALSDSFAQGTLDVEEFERRVTVAHRSDSLAEIERLVADLPVAQTASVAPTRAVVPTSQVQPSGMVLSIMGGTERAGTWSVPRTLNVVAMMGGTRLDLREARLPGGVVEIRVASFMGGVEILVPPTLAVEANGSAIMGGFAHVERASATPDPDSSLVRITGLAVMGGVSIEMRLVGESEREAHRRRKRERKARVG